MAVTPGIKLLSFDEALVLHLRGDLSLEEWEEYCYSYRDACYRVGSQGTGCAARHAARAGLPLPYSDLPNGAWQAEAVRRGM